MFRGIVLSAEGKLRIVWRVLLFVVVGVGLTVLFVLGLSRIGWQQAEWAQRLAFSLALFIAGAILTRLVNRKPVTAIGLHPGRSAFRQFGLGTLLGFLMMGGILAAELLLGSCTVQWRELTPELLTWLLLEETVVFVGAGLSEELLFRGYPFQSMMQGIGFLPAMLTLSVLFALAHAGNPNVGLLALLNIALAGIWLSCAYYRTRALWLPVGLHFSWNFAQSTLFGFPTSGVAVGGRSLLELTQAGPEWLTGGAFGPEGGILATVVLGLGTWHVLVHPFYRAEEGIVTLDTPDPVPIATVSEGKVP